MLDFLKVSTRAPKKGVVEIYPKFILSSSSDLMIRGSDFYAIWDEETQLWSTDENTAIRLIDQELDAYREAHEKDYAEMQVHVLHMWDTDSGSIDKWLKYVKKQNRDRYQPLDEKLIFANTVTTKESYASRKLTYDFVASPTPAYDAIMSTLYSPEERQKLEWAIGSVVAGDSKNIQKFIVMYGAPKTGKSTVLNIIQDLFAGYWCAFDAKTLGSANNSFALEAFRGNPLVGIQHDGDLSRIEDNTRLNSLVSHEVMMMNEKFKSAYPMRFNTFLFMGTNKPVRITDAKSGIIRRLIDVSPSGKRIPVKEYNQLTAQVKFELGGIAAHCLDIYNANKNAYDNYVPLSMMGASNSFYNYVLDNYDAFKESDGTTMKSAWELYKQYNQEANVTYGYSQMLFKEELKSYFREFYDRTTLDNGTRVWNYYRGFLTEKFEMPTEKPTLPGPTDIFPLNCTESLLDKELADCPAQYAGANEAPLKKWAEVKTTLADISTNLLHYVNVPEERGLVVVDFDLKDENGNKSFALNAEAAAQWPKTYAELSKGGQGIHLHYWYTGDTSKLSMIFSPNVEIKVFTGGSSLRRRLTKCNDIPIATITSGLPLKEDKKVINWTGFKNEQALRASIARNLLKKNVPYTKPSMDFIYNDLKSAYESGMEYDVSDMRHDILAFAAQSTHNAKHCIDMIADMHFQSKQTIDIPEIAPGAIVFYDVEVFPNLFIVCAKERGEGKPMMRFINPSSETIELLMRFKLVGFNNRDYDNHMLYARMLKYSNEDLYALSRRIIDNNSKGAKFRNAYNLSYTDIYDFSTKKQSLKKWEIELGIHHQELEFPWDQPVDEKDWDTVAGYCENDVRATEEVFNKLEDSDFLAREILADIAGMTVNDTTNTLTTKIIFGDDRYNTQLVYTHLDTGEQELPVGIEPSAYKNAFPGYEFVDGRNMYRGTDLGKGGYVFSTPGIWHNVALLDIASMHPNSAVALKYFGKHTTDFEQLLQARIYIKHKQYDEARKLFGGKLEKWLIDPKTAKALSKALKIPINSVYGLTSASFENAFYDIRNKNNIVALRGALFMRTLQDEVAARGFTVAHIKTDSIKIPDATPDIIQFCMDFAKEYGYTFEHEATYEKMCLVNDAVYIAKYATPEWCEQTYTYIPEDNSAEHLASEGPWTATGTQFQVPYVFKTLFSKEPLIFTDRCETKSVKTRMFLDFNEGLPEGEHKRRFVGRVGQFCPMISGCGAAELVVARENAKTGEVKYDAVTGTKGYRWMEAEVVRNLNLSDKIDDRYYISLADKARDVIASYGDFEAFAN